MGGSWCVAALAEVQSDYVEVPDENGKLTTEHWPAGEDNWKALFFLLLPCNLVFFFPSRFFVCIAQTRFGGLNMAYDVGVEGSAKFE